MAFICEKCSTSLPSRNQLFKHLRETACGKGLAANAKNRTEKVALLLGYSAIPYLHKISHLSQRMTISSQTPDIDEVVTKAVTLEMLRAIDYARGGVEETHSAPVAAISSDNPELRSYTDHFLHGGNAPGFSCASHTQFRCKQFRQGDLHASCDVMNLKTETLTQAGDYIRELDGKLIIVSYLQMSPNSWKK